MHVVFFLRAYVLVELHVVCGYTVARGRRFSVSAPAGWWEFGAKQPEGKAGLVILPVSPSYTHKYVDNTISNWNQTEPESL